MTGDDLHDILIATLVRQHGGTRQRWRAVVGRLTVHDIRTHPHCNWSVAPSGRPADVGAVEELLDDLRLRHPIVTG